jgi:hypothetical protein
MTQNFIVSGPKLLGLTVFLIVEKRSERGHDFVLLKRPWKMLFPIG